MPRFRSGTEQPWRRDTCWRVVDGPSGRVVVCAIYRAQIPDSRCGEAARPRRFFVQNGLLMRYRHERAPTNGS
jgi:hypothetical protein